MDHFLYLDQQRIGRLQYFLGGLKVILIFVILCIICSLVIEIVNQKASLHLSKGDQNHITRMIAWIPCVLIRLIQQVKRFHDLGKSGWNCLWLLLAGIAWLIVIPCLLFVPGEEKTNQYGPQVVFRDQKNRKKSDYDREDAQMKRCPFCGEKILQRAIKCKHCGEFLNKERETIEKTKRCPFCGEKNPQTAIECKYCGEYFSIGGEEKNGFTHHKF